MTTTRFSHLKEIIQYKKKLNWGDLSPFFHQIYGSLADLEGVYVHGFDCALRRILDKRNWNPQVLGGKLLVNGEMEFARKPQIGIFRRATHWGYEVVCHPMMHGTEVHQMLTDEPDLPFKAWLPHTMRDLIRIANLGDFIRYAFIDGDDADRELVYFGDFLIESTLDKVKSSMDVVKDRGYRVRELADYMASRKHDLW